MMMDRAGALHVDRLTGCHFEQYLSQFKVITFQRQRWIAVTVCPEQVVGRTGCKLSLQCVGVRFLLGWPLAFYGLHERFVGLQDDREIEFNRANPPMRVVSLHSCR